MITDKEQVDKIKHLFEELRNLQQWYNISSSAIRSINDRFERLEKSIEIIELSLNKIEKSLI